MAFFRKTTALAGTAFALAGCSEAEPTMSGPFEASGEIIALSGGDAGAQGACVTCHGLQGEGDGNLVPALAGMDRGYFVRQMEFFAQGMRRHPQMTWIADHTDGPARQKLAQHYAGLPGAASGAEATRAAASCDAGSARLYHEGDAARGIASCASCHGEDGLGAGLGNPALSGQPAPYLAEQLRRWRSGERYGDPQGTMTAISRLLAESELEPLAGYSSALRDASAYPALPEACLRTRRPDPRNGA